MRERSALNSIYSALSPVSFSDEVLSASASDLGVIRGAGLGWSDLGEPKRVAAVLRGDETVRAKPRTGTSANSFPAVNVMEEVLTLTQTVALSSDEPMINPAGRGTSGTQSA